MPRNTPSPLAVYGRYDAGLAGGVFFTEEELQEEGPIRPPEDMPAGPPGLKKRKARHARR